MIERIVGRLFKYSNITTLNRFWASDNFKGGKGGKGGFFGRKNKQSQQDQPYETREIDTAKEPTHKTVRFLKKNELMMKDIEPTPKRQLRFRKKQTFQQAQTQKAAPFVKPEKEDNEQQLIKKSIFFSRSSPAPKNTQQKEDRFSNSQPQLNQYLNSPAPQNKFYDKLSEDLDKIFALFENRNWKELNEIVQNYHQYTPAQDIEKELHSLLINADVGRYVEWIKNVGRSYEKGFSEATLKKLYNGLVSQYRVKELKELLSFFKSKYFNVEYKSIDILLADIEKDSPLKGLQKKVNEKIEIVLDILATQLKYNQKHQSQQTAQVYTLDEWFDKLAHLALNRQVSKGKFIALFQEIFIKHYEYIHLEHIYSSGLFLDIIENYYFGSYVTTAKLQAIFMDMLHSNIDLQSELVRLRNKLITYRIKNGKFAFPNVRRLYEQFQNHFNKEHFEPAVFYFLLLSFSDEKVDKHWFMEKRRILINVGQEQYDIRELFNDPLWTLENKLLESRPAETQTSSEETPAEVKEANQETTVIQQEKQVQTEQQQTSFFKKKNLQGPTETSWKDVQYNRYRYQERGKRLGWTQYKQFDSYYATLKREMEAQGNPYRKQLLQNIILAKLNIETDVYIPPNLPSNSVDKFIEQEFDKLKASSTQMDEQFDEKLDEELAAYQEEDEDYQQQKYFAKIKEVQKILEQDENMTIEHFKDPELHRRTLEYLGDQLHHDMGWFQDFQIKAAIRTIESGLLNQQSQSEDFLFKEPKKKNQSQQYDEDQQDVLEQELDIPIDLVTARRKKYDYDNLTALKSAIKLKKYELALGLCEKIYMEPLILERTAKNIAMVVKSFLIEEHARNDIPDIEDILEQVDTAVYSLSDEYLRSVYDRCDSFDELIWNYSPPKDHKFRYWETALTMARGQELVEMDISNKLNTMKYEPEYDTLPVRERDEFISRNSENWRESLMAELGIVRPVKDQTEEVIVEPYANDQEFFQKFLKEDIFPQEDADIIKEAQAELGMYEGEAEAIEGQEGAVEGEEAAVEGQEGEAVEGEAVEAAAEGEAVLEGEVATEFQEAVEGEGQAAEQAGESAAVEQSAAEAVQEQVQEEVPQQEVEGEQQAQQEHPLQAEDSIFATNILFGPSNFDISAETRVRGYDFNQFLDIARNRIKPMLQELYEEEKEYKKHVINLHSLSEQAKMEDIHYLQKKLFEYQKHVKSISNIAIFMSFGLWDYKFSDYALDPQLAKATAYEFRQKFYNFKKYEGKKGNDPAIVLDNEKYIDISERIDMIYNLEFSEAMIDDLLIRRHRFFKEAEAVVKLPPSPVVEELILWGLRADEPMAIYLGEKIAMLTNQIISHEVATQVGTYLSHRRQIPAERIERCKEALKVVGKINRDNIYDFQQEYQHITNRKHFKEYLQKRSTELDSSALEFLARVDPTHNHQQEIFNLKENLTRGKLVV